MDSNEKGPTHIQLGPAKINWTSGADTRQEVERRYGRRMTRLGSVTIASAIDDLTITRYGRAEVDVSAEEARIALGYQKADEWGDGFRLEGKRIAGVEVTARRCGWRIQVWCPDESEPEVDPLPAPPGAYIHERDSDQPVRLRLEPKSVERERAEMRAMKRAEIDRRQRVALGLSAMVMGSFVAGVVLMALGKATALAFVIGWAVVLAVTVAIGAVLLRPSKQE